MKKNIGILISLVISQCLPLYAFADSTSSTITIPGYSSILNSQSASSTTKSDKKASSSSFNQLTVQDNSASKKDDLINAKNSDSSSSKNIDSIEQNFNLIGEELSPIEQIYNKSNFSSDGTLLRQFGYDLLGNDYNYASNNNVAQNYKIVKGDKVNVYFWSNNKSNINSKVLKPVVNISVNKEGAINIPGVGVVQVNGKTTENVSKDIKNKLLDNNMNVRVTVNNAATVPVFVMGNVKQPGVVYVTQTASFFDVLNFAGGLNKDGSFRNIEYISANKHIKQNIDLYNALLKGNVPKITLEPRSVILVKPIGKIVAVSQGVKHPAIYEFKQKETLKDVVNYAGGFLPTVNLNNIQIERFDTVNNNKKVIDVNQSELAKMPVKDGDLLQFKTLYNLPENTITLQGNVKHPGQYQYVKGMKLSDILKSQDDVYSNTYFYQAVISRTKSADRASATIPISLTEFFKGNIDPELKPMDTIKIYKNTNMPTIEMSGTINNPGSVPFKTGMTLKDLLSVASFDITPNNLVAEISNSNNPKSVKTIYLYDMLKKSSISNDIELKAEDKVLFRQIGDKEIIKTVKILGNVNNPGIYKVYTGMKLKEAIEVAGGLAPNAYLKGLSFYRPSLYDSQKKAIEDSVLRIQEDIAMKVNTLESISDSSEKTDSTRFLDNQQNLINVLKERSANEYGRISINITSNNLDNLKGYENLEIEDGDEIYIPSMPQYVSIMGEVYNQSAIAYNPDQNIKYYIDNVGGITKQANKKEIYVIKANGAAHKVSNQQLEFPDPGDTIVIPRKVVIPLNITSIIKDLTQIGINALNTVYIITKI